MPSFLRNSCFVMFIPALEPEGFSRYFLSTKTCIVSVFLGDGAMIYLLCSHYRHRAPYPVFCTVPSQNPFASLITGGAGSAFYIAENDFSCNGGFRQWKR